jgi:dihydroneopterin aldolase
MNEKDSKKAEKAIKRIEEIINHNEILLTEDLIFNLVKKLVAKFPGKCQKMLLNPKVRLKVLGR